jgi:molybdopterin synthase sulfur carrier subunit
MPRVTVRGYASFGDILGSRDLEISTDAETVSQLLDFLTERFNSDFRGAILDPTTGDVMKGNKILVNGRDIDFLQRLATRLKDGDRVVFFPPVGGG